METTFIFIKAIKEITKKKKKKEIENHHLWPG